MATPKAKTLKGASKNTLLEDAHTLLIEYVGENRHVDLTRIGYVWQGILDLELPVPPSEVAAMLSAYNLVRATTIVDSRTHWADAAAYAAMAELVDSTENSSPAKRALDASKEPQEASKSQHAIGFSSAFVENNTVQSIVI